METDTAQGKQSTTDYKQFRIMPGNRSILKKHVAFLAQSMALFPDLFEQRPILVNEKMEIIDGQHRYTAAKQLGLPVWYTVGGELSAKEAIVLNNNQRNWDIMDYIKSYAAFGRKPYKEVLELKRKHPSIPVTVIVRYIAGPGKNHGRAVRAGELETPTLEIGTIFLDYLEELSDMYPRFLRGAAPFALFNIFQRPGFDFDRLLKKLRMVPPSTVYIYGSVDDITRLMEDIYNWKQQTDIIRLYGKQ